MDTNNPLNSTDNTQNSSNPQEAPAPGASNGEDFQSTAPSEVLNEKTETENLTVQETGDPLVGAPQPVASEGFPMGWAIIISLAVIIGLWVLYKTLKEVAEEASVPAGLAPAASSTKVATAKKPAAKKKSNPNQRRKKTAKKRK